MITVGRENTDDIDLYYEDHSGDRRKVAISVFPSAGHEVVAAMAQYRAKLPDQDLVFFDSTTHPLGDPALRVTDK
jgi:hypothetical protein